MLETVTIPVHSGPFLYLLFRDGVCVYVGMSTQNWLGRIGNHSCNKKVDEAVGIPFTRKPSQLAVREKLLIGLLNPQYNTQGRTSDSDGDFLKSEVLQEVKRVLAMREVDCEDEINRLRPPKPKMPVTKSYAGNPQITKHELYGGAWDLPPDPPPPIVHKKPDVYVPPQPRTVIRRKRRKSK